ncbi:MAG TPA: CPBP family intramembrane metalloprotease, partial [Faecalibacterium sp.]|nr:CPBP family intramembrane metalloprotease [Faecalibacterium sp.]
MHKLNPRTAALLSAFGWAVGYLLVGKTLAALLPAPPGGAARFCRFCLLAPL